MKAYYIFQKADTETINDILDWMRNQERAVYRAALRELAALKKIRPQYVQQKPVAEQYTWLHKNLQWIPSVEIGDHLLQVWLLRKHQNMLIDFLNDLGVEHNGHGVVDILPDELPADKLAVAVNHLFEKYPAGVASVYMQMFQLQTDKGWDTLAEVLEKDPRVTVR